MSVILLPNEHISVLANAIASLTPTGRSLGPQRVRDLLATQNVASFTARYGAGLIDEDRAAISALTSAPLLRTAAFHPAEVLVAAQSYDYQACESPYWGDSLAKELTESLAAIITSVVDKATVDRLEGATRVIEAQTTSAADNPELVWGVFVQVLGDEEAETDPRKTGISTDITPSTLRDALRDTPEANGLTHERAARLMDLGDIPMTRAIKDAASPYWEVRVRIVQEAITILANNHPDEEQEDDS